MSPLQILPDCNGAMKWKPQNSVEKYYKKLIAELGPLQTWCAGKELVLMINPRLEQLSKPVGEIRFLI